MRSVLATVVLLFALRAQAQALQWADLTLLSPITGQPFPCRGVTDDQPRVKAQADLGMDEDLCLHRSGENEYELFVAVDPHSYFAALTTDWDTRSGRFKYELPSEVKEWVQRDLQRDFQYQIDRENAFKSLQRQALAAGQIGPDRATFVMPQDAIPVERRFRLALACYERLGTRPGMLAKLALSGAWALRSRANVPLRHQFIDGGYEEVRRLTEKHVQDGEDFRLAKWLPVYKGIFDDQALTEEGYYVAGMAYFGLLLRDGDLKEARRVLDKLGERFTRIEAKERGTFLRAMVEERRRLLADYLGFERRAAAAFIQAIAAEEFTRARLPQVLQVVAECLRRLGEDARAADWYLALGLCPEAAPDARQEIRAQGRAPGAEAPRALQLGWMADLMLDRLRRSGIAVGAEPAGPDRALLLAVVRGGLGTDEYRNPEWRPRQGGSREDADRVLRLVGQAVLDFQYRLGAWPQRLGETWERELLPDRNRVNRFHCPVTGQPLAYQPQHGPLSGLSPRSVLVATSAPVPTPEGPRWGAYLAGNQVAWSAVAVKPGDLAQP